MATKPDHKESPGHQPADPLEAVQLPALTWEEYVDLRRGLEAQLLALVARWAASQVWPRWFYHATQIPRIVRSRAEAAALGPGWSVTP